MKIIKDEAVFTAEQQNQITELTQSTGLCRQTVAILYGRGIDTCDKIEAFLHPSQKRFLNPFLMSGMKEAVALITRARDEEWSVVVYGDYDADGVCATTVLGRALNDFGIQAAVFVPERTRGYGLSESAIDEIFEEYCPQLFITVDCGISNAKEVDYIKEQGAEVIVTDHHELPAQLPDCICINPKIKDDYPYDNLCGAGVAFKLACALNGREAYSYLDFAAIATVADSVPLTGENRDIVAEGLNLINASPRKNYAEFLNKNGEPVTAQSLAFSVAPKINAAGRMGDANAALALFLASDEKEIYDYSVKLTSYNAERQQKCDELYLSAKQKIKQKGAKGRIIILWDESWNTGFVGIVAARLAEEYCRPALLFVKNGEMLKGSARSVEGVNIFEALKSCGDLITEFGGHSQAAGVNISQERLPELEERLNDYLHANYTAEAFTPTFYVNGEINGPVPQKFVNELEMMEPFGVGNRKPFFTMQVERCNSRLIKQGSQHVAVNTEYLEMMYFSGASYLKLLKSAVPKRLVFDISVSTFKRKKYVKGYVRDVIYSAEGLLQAADEIAANCISNLCLPPVGCTEIEITAQQAQQALDSGEEDGAVFVANSLQTLQNYALKGVEINLFTPSSSGLKAPVVLSPQADCDLSGFERVIYLDNPTEITLKSLEGKQVWVCGEYDGCECLSSLDCDRESLLEVFRKISLSPAAFSAGSAEEAAAFGLQGVSRAQLLFALKVFEELGLIRFIGGKAEVVRGVKTKLTNSGLYNFVSKITDEIK